MVKITMNVCAYTDLTCGVRGIQNTPHLNLMSDFANSRYQSEITATEYANVLIDVMRFFFYAEQLYFSFSRRESLVILFKNYSKFI